MYINLDFTEIDLSGGKRCLNVGCGDPSCLTRQGMLKQLDDYEVKVGIEIIDDKIRSWDHTNWCILKQDLINYKRLFFADNYFDTVVCFDLLEHLDKPDGLMLLLEMERVCSGYLMVFVPRGFLDTIKYQSEHVHSVFDVHKSGWEPDEFVQRGYEVKVLHELHKFSNGDVFDAFFAWKEFFESEIQI